MKVRTELGYCLHSCLVFIKARLQKYGIGAVNIVSFVYDVGLNFKIK